MATDVIVRTVPRVPVETDFQNIVTPDGGFTRVFLVIDSTTGRPYTLFGTTVTPVSLGTGTTTGTNTGDVTLAGTSTYVTLAGQVLTLHALDPIADISCFNEAVDDRTAALLQSGGGITWTYNDAAGTLTPALSLAGHAASELSNGTTGSGAIVLVADATHTGTTSMDVARFGTGAAGTLVKKNTSNVISGTVTFQSAASWYAHHIRITVSTVKNNTANRATAWYLYSIIALNANAGAATLVDSGGDTASFAMSVTGDSGTTTQVWTVQATGPAGNDRSVLEINAASALAVNALA